MDIPEPSKKRLIQLFRLLPELNAETLTSVQIQKLTGWTSSTIRKDLSYIFNVKDIDSDTHSPQSKEKYKKDIFSVHGKSNGYNRKDLIKTIQNTLFSEKSGQLKKCCLIGLGAFGKALTESRLLDNSSFIIAAGFDSSLNRVETLNAPFPLYALSQLERIIFAENIDFAILSADTGNIRETAERLIAGGIKGIVNYSSTVLPSSQNTKTENLSLSVSLQNLAC